MIEKEDKFIMTIEEYTNLTGSCEISYFTRILGGRADKTYMGKIIEIEGREVINIKNNSISYTICDYCGAPQQVNKCSYCGSFMKDSVA